MSARVRTANSPQVDDEISRVQAAARPLGDPAPPPTGPPVTAPAAPADDARSAPTEAPLEFSVDANGTIIAGPFDATVFDTATLLDLAGSTGIRSVDSTPRYRVATTTADSGQT